MQHEKDWSGENRVFRGYYKGTGKKTYTNGNSKPLSWDAAIECGGDFGARLNSGYIDISFDDSDMSETFLNIADNQNWRCLVLRNPSSRHIHTFWKIPETWEYKDGKDKYLACGLIADIHHGGTYIPLRADNVNRFPPEYDILEGEDYQEVPIALYPVRTQKKLWKMKDGDGRDNDLFGFIQVLESQLQLSPEEITDLFSEIINPYIFTDPLNESDIERITRPDAFGNARESFYGENHRFQFEQLAKYLKDSRKIILLDGRLAISTENVYKADDRAIQKAMIEVIPTLSDRNRKEVMKYLELICEEKKQSAAQYIGFNNGVLDIKTDQLYQYNEQSFIFTNVIPWDYVPGAYDELTDHTLDKLACGDESIRALLEECVGYCFYRDCPYNTAFILTGDKANGKSTFLKVLTALLGLGNVISLDLHQLFDRFSTASLFGKLANFGDDISDEFIPDASMFRKITDGDLIKGERKGQAEFFFNPYAKLIFSANTIPRIKDPTGATMRRLAIIPFNATFTKNDADYNPHIVQDLTQPAAMEYLVQIGIQGLKRLLANNCFTDSAAVDAEKDAYETENNPVLAFVAECGEHFILHETTADVYTRYKLFCSENGYQSVAKSTLTKQLKTILGVRVKRMNPRNGKSYDLYVKN